MPSLLLPQNRVMISKAERVQIAEESHGEYRLESASISIPSDDESKHSVGRGMDSWQLRNIISSQLGSFEKKH